MPAVRRSRAFTLIEAMIVVVMVGILAVARQRRLPQVGPELVPGRGARHARKHPQRRGGVSRREQRGISTSRADLSAASLYPSTTPNGTSPNGSLKTAVGRRPRPAGPRSTSTRTRPVRFGYAVIADNTARTAAAPAITNNGSAVESELDERAALVRRRRPSATSTATARRRTRPSSPCRAPTSSS